MRWDEMRWGAFVWFGVWASGRIWELVLGLEWGLGCCYYYLGRDRTVCMNTSTARVRSESRFLVLMMTILPRQGLTMKMLPV